MLTSVFAFSACDNGTLEAGFKSTASDESNPFQCAYKSDKTKFDIDDVTLDFYYGVLFIHIENIIETYSYPIFEVFFDNDDGDKHIIKRVEENFVSEKYRWEYDLDEFDYDELDYGKFDHIEPTKKFNHSESITIPKKLFSRDSGIIWFVISGANVAEDETEFQSFAWISIYYKVTGEKVILSDQEFK